MDLAAPALWGAYIVETARNEVERETARLAALDGLNAARPETDLVLQELVDEVREAFGTDLCMVNLILSDAQYFRAWSGELPADLAVARRDPRGRSMCRYVVENEAPFVVEDFLATEEFRDQHFRVNYGVRFYAGAPLTTSGGHSIGSLCLLDAQPRGFGEGDLVLLQAFAKAVVGRLELLGARERERAAKEEEASRGRELKRILGSAGEGILGLDLGGKIGFANPAAAAMLGYEVWEMVGENMHHLVHHTRPDGAPYPLEECPNYAALRQGEAHQTDGEVYWRKDGTALQVEYASRPVIEGGDVIGAVVTFSDVDERRRADEELRRQRDLYETLLRAQSEVGEGLIIVEGRRVVYANEAFCEISGYGAEELEAMPSVARLLPLGDRASAEERPSRHMGFPEGSQDRQETVILHKSGRPVDVELGLKPLRLDGRPRLMVVVRDVTDRKEAEEALKESEERFRTLTDAALEALIISEQGIILEVNRAYTEIFGYEPSEVIGDHSLECIAPESRELARKNLLSGYDRPYEVVGLRKNGERFEAEIRGKASAYRGRAVRITAVRDITERKRAEKELRESEERFRLVVEGVRDYAIFALDPAGRVASWNEGARRIKGYEAEEIIGEHFSRFYPEEDVQRGKPERELEVALAEGRVEDEGARVRKDGSRFWANVVITALRDGAGRLRGFSKVTRDITERKNAEEALKKSEKRFRSLVQNASDLISVLGVDGTVLYESPSIERMLGYGSEDLVGKNALDFIHPDDRPRILRAFARLSEEGKANPYVEYRFRHEDGSWRHMESSGANLLDEPSVGGIVVNSRDVTERKLLEERLVHQALHDPLTALPNRALLLDRLGHALERADRDEACVAVLFLDLDDFKVVNDSLGHEAGDKLLVEAAERLAGCLRPGNTLARLGGDEFVVLLEDVRGRGEAAGTATRIAEALREPFSLGAHEEVFVSTSIGVAVGTTDEGLPDDLLRRADMAMYEAKRKGKAHHEVFEPRMDDLALGRLRLGTDLRRAIEREEFRVFYQPEVELSTGQIVGFEALVRWEHPEHGLVSPARFIPVAEETGMIVPIGRWVLEEACRQAKKWREQRPNGPPLAMSVNLSARQFCHPDLARDVARALRETGAEPASLILEITESAVMEDARSTIDTLRELEALGVGLAIDDFGTGYSSLSYLRRFPVDYLKIDRSFVDGLEKDSGDTVLVSGIVDLAHALGLKVVGEGVETAEQLGLLRKMGCDLAQGYHFARPLPDEEAGSLLAERV